MRKAGFQAFAAAAWIWCVFMAKAPFPGVLSFGDTSLYHCTAILI